MGTFDHTDAYLMSLVWLYCEQHSSLVTEWAKFSKSESGLMQRSGLQSGLMQWSGLQSGLMQWSGLEIIKLMTDQKLELVAQMSEQFVCQVGHKLK